MRDLHGVLFSGHKDLRLKQRALLFDKFHLWHLADEVGQPPEVEADLAFLRDRGVVADAPSFDIDAFARSLEAIDSKMVSRSYVLWKTPFRKTRLRN